MQQCIDIPDKKHYDYIEGEFWHVWQIRYRLCNHTTTEHLELRAGYKSHVGDLSREDFSGYCYGFLGSRCIFTRDFTGVTSYQDCGCFLKEIKMYELWVDIHFIDLK